MNRATQTITELKKTETVRKFERAYPGRSGATTFNAARFFMPIIGRGAK